MSLEHKKVERFQSEYLCLHCGKSWDINDAEPPACTAEPASSMRVAINGATKVAGHTVDLLTSAFTNYGQPHRTVVAWVLEDSRHNTALLYAETARDMMDYAARIFPPDNTFQFKRLQGMDVHGHGRTPYFEMNPIKLRMASNMLSRPVISLLKFKEEQA